MRTRCSGQRAADATITKKAAYLVGVSLKASAAVDAALVVYNGDATGDKTATKTVIALAVDASIHGNDQTYDWNAPGNGIPCTDGILADVTGGGAKYIIYYRM